MRESLVRELNWDLCRHCNSVYFFRNIAFSTPENQPEKYDIVGDYIVHPPEKLAEIDAKIDRIIADTKLTNPPNK